MAERSPSERMASLTGAGPTKDEIVSVVRDGGVVVGEALLPGTSTRVEFEASNVRRERTGVHARVAITNGHGELGYDSINVERLDARIKLARAAATRAGDLKRWDAPLRLCLDQFCSVLWSRWVEGDSPEFITATAPQGMEWLIEPFVAKGAGTILYGPPKACKSWLGLLWSASLLGGESPWRTARAQVLFVNLERPANTLRGRLWCIERALGHFGALRAWNRRGSSLHTLSASIQRHAAEVDLVVVDSLSRAGTGDLNANDDANEAMDLLNSFGIAWCILAHTPRADASHVYGSQMFDAAADFLVRVKSVVGEDMLTRGVLLDRQAANDAPPCKSQLWALDFDERGLSGVREPRKNEFPELAVDAMTPGERVGEFLVCEGTADVGLIADSLDMPKGSVRRILNTDPRFVRVAEGGKGRGSQARWAVAAREH